MSVDEFSLIDEYFAHRQHSRRDVELGIGDDGAILTPAAQHQLVVATDTLVEGVHFDRTTPPRALGHKVVAVNLSDLAAMGAEPCWLSLALTLPQIDHDWLTDFSSGFHEVSRYYGCTLVGGDTTKGPLTITVTAHGQLPNGRAITRHGAKAGDWIYLSGNVGDAGLGLAATQGRVQLPAAHLQRVVEKLHYPHPRVALGQSLRGIASAAIDISDGLLADLGHLLQRSQLAARIDLNELPLSLALTETVDTDTALRYGLTSGDDYELCFTVPEERRGMLDTALAHTAVKPICIGQVIGGRPGSMQLSLDGQAWQMPEQRGFNHFGDDHAVSE
ncbi:thiamine-phosphate kinase [Idiomarina xiamenensis]|uniref:Thiamine-monophosphate kinase n=1 Tax=Idiomarina xiamenensis 10-D-4 TaxID=740709 RepID=K2KM20_9GAMM|nr:thiamine-phosphate kinase [Idiomarina xiamenensis]EKE87592.1 thiamine monophosphate kinase [Idiomarina xiamenensis 10-D-4]